MATPEQQRRQKNKLLSAIARRSLAKECQITKAMITREKQRFLTSHAVQSATLFDIRKDKTDATDARRQWSVAQQQPIVPYRLDRISVEPIQWYGKKRSTQGFRKICKLPVNLLMWHRMAKDLVEAQHSPRPHIGGWKTRRPDFQIKEIASAITSTNQFVVVADVCRAFPSVNIDAVYELNYLPEALIRRAIDYRSLRLSGGWRGSCKWEQPQHACGDLEMDPAGLLEGSPASNALFSVLMDDLPDHIDDDIQCFVYADNVILVAPNEACAQSGVNALGRYFTTHRAGPFEIRWEVRSARDGFDHLGYWIHGRGDETTISLAPRSWTKLMKRLHEKKESADDTKRWLRASYGALSPREAHIWNAVIDNTHLLKKSA